MGKTLYLTDVVQRAMEQGRTVEMKPADGYGVALEIDGRPITETPSGEGIPWETFDYPLRRERRGTGVSEDAMALAHEIIFSGPEPRCPECYGPRTRFTVTPDAHSVPVAVLHCYRCRRTVPRGGHRE